MFGIGGPELIIIVLVALLFVGPEKLPTVVKTVSGGLRDLRRMANLAQAELTETVEDLVREVERPLQDKPLPLPPPVRGPAGPDLLAEPLLIKRRADVPAEGQEAADTTEPVETTSTADAAPPAATPADAEIAALKEADRAASPWPVSAPILSGWNSGTQPRTAPVRRPPAAADTPDDEAPPKDDQVRDA